MTACPSPGSADATLAMSMNPVQAATRPSFARNGPVHFQPIEWELEPVLQFLRGRVLNAGCGNRDISYLLSLGGADEIVNYDIDSSLPNALRGPLEQMPFEAESFDSVLCNAVLEHVIHIDDVMNELTRVLRPGGYAVISIPFLQPFHACPTDFRRYTCDGIRQLATSRQLEVLSVSPVHSFAQTVSWIIWEHLSERRSRLRPLVYPVLWIATRLWHKTDPASTAVANAFQMVCRKPDSARPDLSNQGSRRVGQGTSECV